MGRKLEREREREMMRNAIRLLIQCFRFQSKPQMCVALFRGELKMNGARGTDVISNNSIFILDIPGG